MSEVRMNLDVYLSAIVAGDPDAFARWMARAEPDLRRSLTSFAGVVDTEAALQEALLRVWQVAPRFEPDGKDNGLFRLAVRICRNLAIDEVRRSRTRGADLDELERRLDAHEVTGGAPDPHLRRLIQDCRDKLPNKPAQALSARLESSGGEPDAALAARLGMKKNTFLQNFTRARKLLRECLEGQGVDLEGELA